MNSIPEGMVVTLEKKFNANSRAVSLMSDGIIIVRL